MANNPSRSLAEQPDPGIRISVESDEKDDKPPVLAEPSFGISEGTRDEIERNGTAVSPFTGKTLTRDDLK